jgi:hypothetical protein
MYDLAQRWTVKQTILPEEKAKPFQRFENKKESSERR